MRTLEIGLVLPMEESWTDGATPRWVEIRELATRAEAVGFDTVWIPDELLWRHSDGDVHGWWECIAMTGAVAAATSRVKVGTWVLSALHRNPAITAKAVETLDEISGGRFVFGLGSGHAGRQAQAFGLSEDHVIGFLGRPSTARRRRSPMASGPSATVASRSSKSCSGHARWQRSRRWRLCSSCSTPTDRGPRRGRQSPYTPSWS